MTKKQFEARLENLITGAIAKKLDPRAIVEVLEWNKLGVAQALGSVINAELQNEKNPGN